MGFTVIFPILNRCNPDGTGIDGKSGVESATACEEKQPARSRIIASSPFIFPPKQK